ncbi:unnamed protein product [Vitrella brassicaformis CCMP3155]|uniref:Uncharacterized protein n=1 Tax=Vitrella brassicaformis (strain CCMP3155) TaxID=1169540 RepID=A0A0G4FMT1_VITBC|nr:unnamed protein product [Vitrella brassicaformis CCMP3155]|mmetsp:Transcript_22752/g.56150  ORF Transcript_22752/g.56150 Transcript_22752/m.56150 type:complete len:196 (-) Transcript_22752:304-891(-)|eukprot:CEM15559.1 unnamed protein product [Vitrella brassicaformis CCMP3155]
MAEAKKGPKKHPFGGSGGRDFRGFGSDPGNITAAHRIFEETVNKELKHLRISPVFQLRLKKLSLVEDKITNKDRQIDIPTYYARPHTVPSKPQPAGAGLAIMGAEDKWHNRDPIDKYPYPMCASHDYGWSVKQSTRMGITWNPGGLNSRLIFPFTLNRWYTPKNICDEVKYAQVYVKTKGVGPFDKVQTKVQVQN